MKGVINFDPFFSTSKTFGKTLDDIFNRSLGDFVGSDISAQSPSVNVRESGSAYDLELAAPGLSKDDFNIEVDKNRLIISAEMKSENEETDTETKYRRREFNYASFKRSFTLPETVNKDSIGGKYENGILYVTIPKKEKVQDEVKKIEIS